MDRLRSARAPLALVALVALTLVALARVGLGLSQLGPGGSRAVAAARLAPNASDAALTVLAGALVLGCAVTPVVPGRRRLATWGAVLCGISLAASVVAVASSDLAVTGWRLVWLVPDLVVPVIVGVGLALLALPGPAPATSPAEHGTSEVAAGSTSAPAAGPGPKVPWPDEPAPELLPSFAEDAAAGAVWLRAGDAARGAPAAGWGSAEGTAWDRPVPPALSSGPDDRPGASSAT